MRRQLTQLATERVEILSRRTGGRRRVGPYRRLGRLCCCRLGRRRPRRLGRLCRLLRTCRWRRRPSRLRSIRLLSAGCWPLCVTHRDPRRSGPGRRCSRGSRRLWRSDFRFGLWFRFWFFCFSCRSRSGRCCGGRIRLFRRRLVALDQFCRHARGRARHSLRENWRTVASQLFFAVERIRIENFGGIELAALRAAGNHQRER